MSRICTISLSNLNHIHEYRNILNNVVLNNLIKVGLCPKLTVYDQGTTIQSASELLNISEDDLFF